MQIYNINNSQSFGSKGYAVKEIRGHLADDSTALIKIMHKGSDIRMLACAQYKKGKRIGGKGIAQRGHLSEESIASFFENIQAKAKNGVDFFAEFTKALISKN